MIQAGPVTLQSVLLDPAIQEAILEVLEVLVIQALVLVGLASSEVALEDTDSQEATLVVLADLAFLEVVLVVLVDLAFLAVALVDLAFLTVALVDLASLEVVLVDQAVLDTQAAARAVPVSPVADQADKGTRSLWSSPPLRLQTFQDVLSSVLRLNRSGDGWKTGHLLAS